MKRFKNILVITGGDADPSKNPAVARGARLAEKNNARLTLMDVVDTPEDTVKEYKGIISSTELTAMFIEQRENALDHAAEQLREKGIEINTKVVAGRDFIEIVRQMLYGEHDLLIKIANHHTRSFDNSDFNLMRKCPEPVWLIKPRQDGHYRRVLAAVDLTLEKSHEGSALNALILDLASSLASWNKADLHLLSCWSIYGEDALRHSGFLKVSESKISDILSDEQQASQSLLDKLAANHCQGNNSYECHKHLVKGDPKIAIPEFVRNNGVDVVIMGTIGRSGIPGLLIGNTAETVLQSIDSSVITVKPPGFKSPVT